MRRSPALLFTLILIATLGGCGGDEEAASDAPVGYVPADSPALISLSTDLESEDWQALEDKLLAGPLSPESVGESLDLGPIPPPTSLEGFLRQLSALGGLDYDEDVEPLLGGSLVLAAGPETLSTDAESFVAVLGTGDGEVLRGVLESLELREAAEYEGAAIYTDESGFTQVAVDGDTLVFADGDESIGSFEEGAEPTVPNAALAEAIDRERDGSGLDPELLAPDELPEEALIRVHGDLTGVLESPDAAPFAEVPWLAALETVDASVSVTGDAITGDAVISTDSEALTDDDLPLAPATETPELVRVEGEIAGASANQSQTTTFLLEMVRSAYPDSAFVEDVATLERELGIDFEGEFLEQFNGPSASTLPLSDEFAARSEVADPEAMAATLREIAPDVGRLVQDLQGLQGRGLIPLFLLAPDAPIAPGVLDAARIQVETVPGEPDLYLISELIPPGAVTVTPLPQEIVFGLIDDVFVVASDLGRAREIAAAPGEAAPDDLEGSSISAGDLGPLRDEIAEALGVDPGPIGELTASASIDTSAMRLSATVELP